MRRVIIESPWKADSIDQKTAHIDYLREAIQDCLERGDSPYASHGLLTAVLDDADPEQRELGIAAGLAWGEAAEATVVYQDLGVTEGMQAGIDHAIQCGRPVERRNVRLVKDCPQDAWAEPADVP